MSHYEEFGHKRKHAIIAPLTSRQVHLIWHVKKEPKCPWCKSPKHPQAVIWGEGR